MSENIREIELESEEKEEESGQIFVEGFGEFIGGQRVSISRKLPLWCKGHLETIPVEGFDLQYIKENHGGGSYAIRFLDLKGNYAGEHRVDIAGKPTDFGTPLISPEEQAKQDRLMEIQAMHMSPQQNTSGMLEMFTTFMGMLTSSQAENSKMLLELAKKGSAKSNLDLAQLTEMADFVQSLKGDGGQGGGGEDESPSNMILKIMELAKDQQNAAPAPQIGAAYLAAQGPGAGRPAPPRPARPAAVQSVPAGAGIAGRPPTTATPAAVAPPAPIEPPPASRDISPGIEEEDDEEEIIDIAEALADMEPEEIAMCMGEMLEKCSESKRVALLSMFGQNVTLEPNNIGAPSGGGLSGGTDADTDPEDISG